MLIFNIYAIRAIVSVVIICTSLVAPPILLLQTRRQLRLTGFPAKSGDELEVKSAPNVQQPAFSEKNSLSHAQSLLEKVLLKPNSGLSGIKIPLIVDLVNDSLSQISKISLSHQQSPTLILSTHLLTADDWLGYSSECPLDEPLDCPNISLLSTLDIIFSESEIIFNSSLFMAENLPPATIIPQRSVTTSLTIFTPKQQFSLLAFLKWLRLYIRELILSSLPKPVSEWMVNNRIALGVICVSVMFGSLLTPLLYYLWTQVSAKNKLVKNLQAVNSTQSLLDVENSKLRQENDMITGNLSTTKNLVTLLEKEVSKTKLKLKEMQKSKNMAEIKLDCMTSDLQNMESEVERMEEEETEQRNTIDSLLSEKSELSQLINEQNKENFALCQTLDELIDENASLVESLSTLKKQQKKMEVEFVETKQQTENIQEELEAKNAQLVEQEKEIAELRECLSEVTHQTAQLATQSIDCLDTDIPTKNLISDVQIVLKRMEKPFEVDGIEESKAGYEILNMETVLEQLTDENNVLRQENAIVKTKITEAQEELTKTQLNYKGVIEYLSSKEDTLRRELYNREAQLKEFEKLRAEAKERLLRRNEEIKKEREEWIVTKNGLEDLLKSLNSQVYINQDRAQRAMEFVKTTEQKLRAADKEIMTLKQTFRLTQKRPVQQSRRLDIARKSPVYSHSHQSVRQTSTSPVKVTKEQVSNDHRSSSSHHVRTKQFSQAQTQDQTSKATLIRCTKPSEVFCTFIGWSTEANQLLPETESQRQSNQLETPNNNQQDTHGNQQLKDNIRQVTYNDQQVAHFVDQQATCRDQQEGHSDLKVMDIDQQLENCNQQVTYLNTDQDNISHINEEVHTEHKGLQEVPSDHAKTDSTEINVANWKQNEDISTVKIISGSLSTGFTAESSPKDITSEVNAPISNCDIITADSKPVVSKRNKYMPKCSSPLLFASKSHSSSLSVSEDGVRDNILYNNLPTEEMTNSLSTPDLPAQEGIDQELDCNFNDSGVSVAGESAHTLGATRSYTRTYNVAEVDGDSDSYYNVV